MLHAKPRGPSRTAFDLPQGKARGGALYFAEQHHAPQSAKIAHQRKEKLVKPISYYRLALQAAAVASLLAASGNTHADTSATANDAPIAAQSDTSPVRALFRACHLRTGCEPWITDGTRAGTQVLRNIRGPINDRPQSSYPSDFVDLGDGRVAFSVTFHRDRQGRVSREPYITDGTRAGTGLVARTGSSSTPTGYTSLGDGRYVFAARSQRRGQICLWVTDGTRQETSILRCTDWQWHMPYGFTPLRDGQVVLAFNDAVRGAEPWITDGTREGTRLLRNIGGDTASNPGDFVQIAEGVVIFTVSGQVWATDGTRRGTQELVRMPPSTSNNRPRHLTAIGGGKALFQGNFHLWITDGTQRGTQALVDRRGDDVFWPENFVRLGDGLILFTARDRASSRHVLWTTDGTPANTRVAARINPRWQSFSDMQALGDGRAVFFMRDGTNNRFGLWVSDGTREGTDLVQRFREVQAHGDGTPRALTSMGDGRALFAYDNGRTGMEPWVTDGTRAGTHLLRNIHAETGSMTFSHGDGFTPFIPVLQ